MVVATSLHPAISEILVELIRGVKTPEYVRSRAEIMFYTYQSPELSTKHLSQLLGVSAKTIRKHQSRFHESLEALELVVNEGNRAKLRRTILDCLEDAPRSGRPPMFAPEQIVSVISLACEKPEASGLPVTKWTHRELGNELVKRLVVPQISSSHIGRILRSVNLQPHKTKGWCFTTEKDQAPFHAQVQEVCQVYLGSKEGFEKAGIHVVCVDEMTGLQANEKRAETLPPLPDQLGKEETQYTRHGTLCLTAAWDVPGGKIISQTIQETRNNHDFAHFIERVLKQDPDGKWIFVLDNLNTHSSEMLVRLIARLEGIDPHH